MYNSIFMDEFYQKEKKETVNILDVREIDEFDRGHIAQAENMPLSGLAGTYESLNKETPYYVICHSGSRSAMACDFLASKGYQVTNVMGGMSAWRGALV